jgi:hypothetical protein
MPPIVYTQPAQTMVPTRQGLWSVDLCDCFSDFGDCLCAFFYAPCYMSLIYGRANEGCCSCFVPLSQLRTKVRVERVIHVVYKFQSISFSMFFFQSINFLSKRELCVVTVVSHTGVHSAPWFKSAWSSRELMPESKSNESLN